jgi:glycosyltransferase involved in cell wall biosynthesis
MAPRVSILMATYNMAQYLSDAIESVLAQEFSDFELLIGDNLSTDGTPEIALEYARRDSRIQYHRNAVHMTAAQNFNHCYERSNPDSSYWIMLASDDWWKPNLLSTAVEILDEDPTLTFAHCDAALVNPTGESIGIKYSELWPHISVPRGGHHTAVSELFHGCYVMALATLVSRRAKNQIYPLTPLMDPSLVLTPDHNLWLQLMVRGATAYFVDEPLAFYRKHDTAMTMPWNDRARLREEVIIFREKLAGVCPPELEEVRIQALRNRLAQLGFDLLASRHPTEARAFLDEANSISDSPRLDISVARVVSGLPLPAQIRAGLWQRALRANATLGRMR